MSLSYVICYPTEYDWGSPAVPPTPRGFYKPFWQALDGGGAPRIYPSRLMQCVGITEKHDYWWASDFDRIMTYINGGFQWAPYINQGGLWIPFTALYLTLHGAGFLDGAGHFWDVLWTIHYDASYAPRWYAVQSRIQAPNTTKRLYDGATYPYNAAPWSNDIVVGGNIAISNMSSFGDVWDNAV